MGKRNVSWPCQDSKPGSSSSQPSHYTDYTIPAAHTLPTLPVSELQAWQQCNILRLLTHLMHSGPAFTLSVFQKTINKQTNKNNNRYVELETYQ
jgi:hypothetical protein